MSVATQPALPGIHQGKPVAVKGRKRGARPKPAPCWEPNRGVVLGIDPAATSGWAVLAPPAAQGSVLHGIAKTHDERVHAIAVAQEVARRLSLPLVVVGEKWSQGGVMGHAQLAGLNAAWGRWEVALDFAGVTKARRLRTYVQTWHPAVLGKGHGRAPNWKAICVAWVRATYGIEVGPDEADAIAIARWGQYAGEVAALLPTRAVRG